ncbi:hypothetical protein AB9K41_19590 [Cribrihabitans sp. XS_ASV171]
MPADATSTDPVAGRPRFYVILMTAASLAGALVIVAFTLGMYSWEAIAISVAAGAIIGVPLGILFTRWMKRDDPAWDESRDRPKPPARSDRVG